MTERTLYRSKHDQMISGVCAGLADYFGLDPTVVRLLAVLAAVLSSGGAIIAYVVLWLVVPEEPVATAERGVPMSEDTTPSSIPGQPPPPPSPPSGPAPAQPVEPRPAPVASVTPPLPSAPPRPPLSRGRGPVWIGLALVFVGLVLLVQMFVPQVRLWAFWPVVLIIWGLVVIFRSRGGE
jgi:phage shock protein C